MTPENNCGNDAVSDPGISDPGELPRQYREYEGMIENQHKKITGYRDLTQDEINLMNTCKHHGMVIGIMIEELEKIETIDKRWLAIAKTDLQKGFMALIRSIAKPETF